MTSIEVTEVTAAALQSQAARAGISLDAYVRRLAVFESVRLHNDLLGEQYHDYAEVERLTD